jgi:hypothetical protein
MSGDAIGIVYFNRPSHGMMEGGLDAITSRNDGQTWEPAPSPAPPPPGENRMHIGSGVDHTGAWIVLSTGFSLVDGNMAKLQPLWLSRLPAGSPSWEIFRTVKLQSQLSHPIPHGRILALDNGSLAATFYQSEGRGKRSRACIAFSRDSGRTWSEASLIGDNDANEACLHQLDSQTLVAATRTQADHHVVFHRSVDAGRRWNREHDLTLPMQHPADLTEVGAGRLLLTYGIRNRGLMGIGARLSKDRGETWSPPVVLFQFGDATDCGYPSTVVCENGTLLTVCYSDLSPLYAGYHMMTLRWKLEEFFDPKPLRSISDGNVLKV